VFKQFHVIITAISFNEVEGDRKGIRPAKKNWVLVCWWRHFYWRFICLRAPVVTTTSITLSCNKIRNGNILLLFNQGPRWTWC